MLTVNFGKSCFRTTYTGMNGSSISMDSNVNGRYWADESSSGHYAYFPNFGYGDVSWAMDIGFGDTPESKNDYNLADGNYANRKLTLSNFFYPLKQTRDVKNFGLIATNDGEETVTVKEIGIFCRTAGYAQRQNTNAYTCVARKVLDTPIVMEPGDQYMFMYKIYI